MIKIIGYTPDINPTTPGALVDCNGYVPSLKGMKSAPGAVTGTLATAIPAASVGAAVLTNLANTRRFFAGSAAALYEGGASTWTDRTRSVGGAYATATDGRWRFAQFGNVALATNKADTMQFSTAGAFANITSGIKASVIETCGNFIVAADTNEGTYGDCSNRWWVTPDYTNWNPSITNLIATGLLVSAPGPIRAVRRFGDGVVMYKERAMYYGVFVGPPMIFEAREIPGECGVPSQEAVAVVGTPEQPRHLFMGFEDFYSYDGSRPIPIGMPVRQTVFSELSRSYFYKVQALHDRINSLVYFFYPSSAGNGSLDKCVVYNYRTDRWGRDDRTIETAVEYVYASMTYDDLGTYFSTYGTSIDVSYDSPFFTSGSVAPAIINTSHVLQTLTGTSGSAYMTLGDIGDELTFSLMRRVQPRFLTRPTSASLTNYYRNQLGDSLTSGITTNMNNSRFDLLREARWHRLRLNTTGNSEVSDMRIDFKIGGSE